MWSLLKRLLVGPPAPPDPYAETIRFDDTGSVSYTHLDVYKRQGQHHLEHMAAQRSGDETRGHRGDCVQAALLARREPVLRTVLVLSLIHI